MIDIRDILTLDDNNEYVVVSKISYEDKIYYYLVDKNDNVNLKFCYENGDSLVELNDKVLVTKLLPLFLDAAKNVNFDD